MVPEEIYNSFKQKFASNNQNVNLPEKSGGVHALCESLQLAGNSAKNFMLDRSRIGDLYECLMQLQDLNELAESYKQQYKQQLIEFESRLPD